VGVGGVHAVSATEFKARCLDLLDQVNGGAIGRLDVTKRGMVVAVVTRPPAPAAGDLRGFLRGSVVIPPGLDLTAPTGSPEPTNAEMGILHR
jgi:antitoxin (DNA-binding transcriptional repressor) of toxin-antitoxin stability system